MPYFALSTDGVFGRSMRYLRRRQDPSELFPGMEREICVRDVAIALLLNLEGKGREGKRREEKRVRTVADSCDKKLHDPFPLVL